MNIRAKIRRLLRRKEKKENKKIEPGYIEVSPGYVMVLDEEEFKRRLEAGELPVMDFYNHKIE